MAVPGSRPGGRRAFRRVLVANRGEIARRITRTARDMGLQVVAIHSDPDAGELFVRDADLAVAIGGRTAAESYLDIDRVIGAALRSGADAVHPGYGFLAENPDFAAAVQRAGLVWIGPPEPAMRAMALKVQAKRLVAAAGVPLIPGAELPDAATADEILAAGQAVGLPLLVKASAGGGGTGMRLVHTLEHLIDEVDAARAEAAAAFGDPTVFLERHLARGRHVEVQVFGDEHGSLVHLFERECSIQRRHQKLVEESPSPGATRQTLQRMYDAALAAARAISYVGAGTVEFMVTGAGAEQEFFFLEMNTRLQVEHPVTEAVTGLDLVEWQIRIARGEALPLTQEQVTRAGHAIEVRLYAEDPAAGHLPGSGPVDWFEAQPAAGLRLETAVATGSQVSSHYDPLLAKVIAHGPTRDQAAARLAANLATLQVAGVPTNRDALVAVLASPAFLAGDTTTAFLDEHPDVNRPAHDPHELGLHVAAATLGLVEQERAAQPWAAFAAAGWRNLRAGPQVRRFARAGLGEPATLEVHYTHDRAGRVDLELVVGSGAERVAAARSVSPAPDAGSVSAASQDGSASPASRAGSVSAAPGAPSSRLRVDRMAWDDGQLLVEVGGLGAWFRVRRAGRWVIVTGAGSSLVLEVLPRFDPAQHDAVVHGLVTPVPGTVTAVLVEVGDVVAAGEPVVLLEAMKMQHRIRADSAGVVSRIAAAVGESVDAHQVVAVVEPD